MYAFVSLLFLGWIGTIQCINLHPDDAKEMTKALDCMPLHDRNLFNSVFIKLRDLEEVVLLQGKALYNFAEYLKIGGNSYCTTFVNMVKVVEDTLSYDIYKLVKRASNKTQSQLNHARMVEDGWYDSLNYIRLLPNDIRTQCEANTPIKSSLVDGKTVVTSGRVEKSILKCITPYRGMVVRLAIAKRLN
jgi:hypothetical protein